VLAVQPTLGVIARRQHGTFHHQQVLRCGMTQRDVQLRLISGDWLVLQPDVYIGAGTPLTHLAQCWAATLAVGAPVALRRRSAAHVLGLDRAPFVAEQLPELLIPSTRHPQALGHGVHVHRVRPSRFAVELREGLPVTPAAFTLRELAFVLPVEWTRDMVMHALRRRTVTLTGLAAQLGRGWPGAAKLREVLLQVAPGYQVVWEGQLHEALEDAGLSLAPQLEVVLPAGGLAVLDLGCRRLRFGVEIDGVLSHLERFAADRRRDRRLHQADWHVEHVAATEVAADLAGVVAEIKAAALLRAHRLGTTPHQPCTCSRTVDVGDAAFAVQSSGGGGGRGGAGSLAVIP
jgi:hypothetical protein